MVETLFTLSLSILFICLSIGVIIISLAIFRSLTQLAAFLQRYKFDRGGYEKNRFVTPEPPESKEKVSVRVKSEEVPQIDPAKFLSLKKPPRAPGGFGMVEKNNQGDSQ